MNQELLTPRIGGQLLFYSCNYKIRFMRSSVILFFIAFLLSPAYSQVHPDSTFNTLIRTENGGWVAGDATYSIALPDGRTLWLFGDSFIGTVNPDSSLVASAKMIRNGAVLQEGEVMTAQYNGTFENPEDFVPTDDPETWFWPEHGLVENNTLKIIMSEFGPNGDTTGWNFEFRSTYVALFTYPEIELIGSISLPYYTSNGVMYGDRLIVDGDYTYIYGRKEEVGNIPYAHLARTLNGDLLSDWEFYDGSGWTDQAEESIRLTNQPVSQQFGVFMHEEKWVMVTQEIWLGSKIYSMVADHPEGPWTNLNTLYETPRPYPSQFTYNAYPHPQFDDNNELLVSYNSNGSFWDIFSNVELYRPQFIRVPYVMIDTSFAPTAIPQILMEEEESLIVKTYPNPAGSSISLHLTLRESADFSIQLFDISGHLLKTIPAKHYPAGKHALKCDLANFPSGVIVYHIQDKVGWFIHN